MKTACLVFRGNTIGGPDMTGWQTARSCQGAALELNPERTFGSVFGAGRDLLILFLSFFFASWCGRADVE